MNILGDQIAFIQAPLFPALTRIVGIWGIAILILLVNSLVSYWLTQKSTLARNGIVIVFLVLIASSFHTPQFAKANPVKVALIQHNFPIPTDWRVTYQKEIIKTYEQAIRQYGKSVDLVVFPQYGLPIDVLRHPTWLNRLSRSEHTSILLATYIPKEPGGSLVEGERFDSALLFSPHPSNPQEYRAVTPPPFRNIGQVLGSKRTPLQLSPSPSPLPLKGGEGKGEGVKIGVMLCYEDVRSEEGRLWIQNGAEIITALSNPGHFLGTPLPRYHLLHD
ncbi:MAG: hypothetical protein HY588_04025, partial [Candidatus Omnitrophica bacterium]|nr:hypothetical protein [Candidatus Omnitrophota bacterium]